MNARGTVGRAGMDPLMLLAYVAALAALVTLVWLRNEAERPEDVVSTLLAATRAHDSEAVRGLLAGNSTQHADFLAASPGPGEAQARVLPAEHSGNSARVKVHFTTPGGGAGYDLTYVLHYEDRRWKVDLNRTDEADAPPPAATPAAPAAPAPAESVEAKAPPAATPTP